MHILVIAIEIHLSLSTCKEEWWENMKRKGKKIKINKEGLKQKSKKKRNKLY